MGVFITNLMHALYELIALTLTLTINLTVTLAIDLTISPAIILTLTSLIAARTSRIVGRFGLLNSTHLKCGM